ncbi:MAG: CaiB/BaiF CoA transferase family protein, partial [Acidimicrobiales bacterium]
MSPTDSTAAARPPLAGVRILEVAILGPGAITTSLADLGADIVKIESPQGDYIRQMTWPIVEGVSLMHLHISRGKRSLVLDLKSPEGVATFLELARESDAVIEGMRPGALERCGLGYDELRKANPRIVFCGISGYGATGPYRNLPSHGIAYDTWAGLVNPAFDEDGFPYIPEHPSMGIHAGPLFGALGVLAGIIRARDTGEGCRMEIAQSDAAAAMDWLRSETYKAYERPESEVTGNKSDNYERRAPGTAGMKGGVRYQIYASADGYVLFMASEREFWKNFCEGIGRPDLFEAHPGSQYADHARGDLELRDELTAIFKTRTTGEWVIFGEQHNTTLAPVNTPKTIADDPQFQDRMPWMPASEHGIDMLPIPIKLLDEELPAPSMAPTVGQHS